jgi:hypothetical protein
MIRKNEKAHTLLIEKADQVRKGAEILIDKTRNWQVIKQYLSNRLNEIVLNKDQEKQLERYQFIYNDLVSSKYTEHEVMNRLMNMYGIKLNQAYEDLNCSKELFTTVININKIFELQVELQSARDMKRKCIEIQDFKTAAALQKNIIAITAMFPDAEENAGDLFEGHTIEAVFDPRLLGAPDVNMDEILTAINAKRKTKINTKLFQPISFEDK